MAIIFKSKYDKLGLWGWFIYIPFLLISFWLMDVNKYKSLLLLWLFLPILNGIVKNIHNYKTKKKLIKHYKDNPGIRISAFDKKDLKDIKYDIWILFILFGLLGFLIYWSTTEYNSFEEFRLLVIESLKE